MKVLNNNIVMEEFHTVDTRDVSEDGKILDKRTYARIPNTLVERDANSFADLTAARAAILETTRRINFVGEVTGSFAFNGGQDVDVSLHVSTSGSFAHEHDAIYYTKAEIDAIVSTITPTFVNHVHAILKNGDGMAFFNYNGSTNTTVSVAFAGISGDFGAENRYVARSDHKHDAIYYTKTQIDASPNVRIVSDGNFIQLINNNNVVVSQTEVSTSLTLSPGSGRPGLPLMGSEDNNEPNKVVRTDANGYIKAKGFIVSQPENASTTPVYVWVDTGDGKLVRSSLQALMSNSGISGYEVTQHYHTELRSKTDPAGQFIYAQQQVVSTNNGAVWALTTATTCQKIYSNTGNNVSVFHANNADYANRANYADLAEIYSVKGDADIGTLVQVSKSDEFELEVYNNYPFRPVGVVSKQPGFILNAADEGKKHHKPIALKGKTPVRVVGSVKKGDPIVPGVDGHAKVAGFGDTLNVFAYALEDNKWTKSKLVMCVII